MKIFLLAKFSALKENFILTELMGPSAYAFVVEVRARWDLHFTWTNWVICPKGSSLLMVISSDMLLNNPDMGYLVKLLN